MIRPQRNRSPNTALAGNGSISKMNPVVIRLTVLLALLDFGPGVFQGNGAVEDELASGAVGIDAEVALPMLREQTSFSIARKHGKMCIGSLQ